MNLPRLALPALALSDGDVYTGQGLMARGAAGRAGPLAAVPAGGPASPVLPRALFRPSTATPAVRDQARAWLRVHEDPGVPAKDEEALLHAAETSAVLRPPVPKRARVLDDELVWLYLLLASRWRDLSQHTGDLRYLNAALKVTASAVLSTRPPGRSPLAHHLVDTLARLLAELADRPLPALPPLRAPSLRYGDEAACGPGRIAVLAGQGSRGLPLFLNAAVQAGFDVHGVVLHAPRPVPLPDTSAYATAWYPVPHPLAPPCPAPPSEGHPTMAVARAAHGDWTAIAAQLRAWQTGLLVLLGMEDIVPSLVLDAPTTATVNAHNGALPAYRGMDAVAWSMLAAEHPLCTVHIAAPDVDAGEILASALVSAHSLDLRSDIKAAQISLLTGVCSHYTRRGALPAGQAQEGQARRYYRMHPALRRVLDHHYPLSRFEDLAQPVNGECP